MPLSSELYVTVGLNFLSAFIMLGGGLFVLLQNPRRDINRLFFFLSLTTLLYTVFFAIASLQTDYQSAYFWWYLNVVDCFIPMAVVHFIFRVINRQESWRWFIVFTYVAGFAIFIAALIHPNWFLPTVTPKLYFPYYLNAGWLYSVMLALFIGAPLVVAGNLLSAYLGSTGILRKRLEYFGIAVALGYAVGCLNFLLVYNVPVDPIFGSLVGIYFIPIAYGIFSTDLLDIRIVVRRALYYALGVGVIAAFLIALILLNNFLTRAVPVLTWWTVPVLAAIGATLVVGAVLRQSRENERLKYEFITVVTHKLRTPLTQIHWLIPELLTKVQDESAREGLRHIDEANNRLIELTNVLMESAHSESAMAYQKTSVDLAQLVTTALNRFETQITEKHLAISVAGEAHALADPQRLSSVVDVLVENAVTYTPAEGKISITLAPDPEGVRLSVTDSGIGVKPEDRERIFSGLFRTDDARRADTEGFGLGLSLSRAIIERQGGRIGVESEGEGKGSTFWFTLPRA